MLFGIDYARLQVNAQRGDWFVYDKSSDFLKFIFSPQE